MKTQGFLLKYPEGKSEIGTNGNLPTKDLTVTTWLELKDKRDAGKLTPDSLYRITDYQCTTTQENTRSAGHQFDIVLLALSENKLAEEGWAMMHDNVYDVTFSDGSIIKCYLTDYVEGSDTWRLVDKETLLSTIPLPAATLSINEDNKTITITESEITTDLFIEEGLTYNYFQNSNLSAWKVWYCLDNDTARFAWAQEAKNEIIGIKMGTNPSLFRRDNSVDAVVSGTTYYGWKQDGSSYWTYTTTETPKVGDSTWAKSGPPGQFIPMQNPDVSYVEELNQLEGTGVIYRLIDEFNNDIKYDFKNIQFKRKLTNGSYDANGTETWCYTLNVWYNDMCQDASIVGNTLPNDEGYINGVHDNKFGYATAYDLTIEGVDTFAFALGDNAVLSFDDGGYFGIFSNTIGNSFYNNTIGNEFNNNTIGNRFASNTIGVGFNNNTIGNSFINKTISDNTNYKNYGNSGVELATKS